jgi:hypothetical protein
MAFKERARSGTGALRLPARFRPANSNWKTVNDLPLKRQASL